MNKISGQRVLVLGAGGMLAGDVVPQLRARKAELFLADIRPGNRQNIEIVAADLTNVKATQKLVADTKPNWIVNCAAYTAVDQQEGSYDLAFAVNSQGPFHLAEAAGKHGAKLLHLSTDYVFGRLGNNGKQPWKEDDEVHPCGIYGHSKFYGEELVRRVLPDDHLIVRTAWLHGLEGANFVHTMLRIGREQGKVKVVDDQIGSPTWAWWLGQVLIDLMERDARGTFHATSRGNISWFDFAREIFDQAGIQVELARQTTEELRRPAPRPSYSTLALEKLEAFLGRPCQTWQEGVKGHLALVRDSAVDGKGLVVS